MKSLLSTHPEKAFKNPKISFLWDSAVEEVLGKQENGRKRVKGLKIRQLKTGEITTFPAEGLFIGIGHVPNTAIFKDQLATDQNGYLIVESGSTQTSVPGVFAAGDVADSRYRQAVTAAGTGCMAAMDAEKFLEHRKS